MPAPEARSKTFPVLDRDGHMPARSRIAFESGEDTAVETWHRFRDIGVWASDYPHFDGEDAGEAIEHVQRASIAEEVQAQMLGLNACRMYGIEPNLVVTERLPVPADALPHSRAGL
jgi:hypothetical protein